MALKITAQIGTDHGITSEAYVRIADYQVSKYGSANFRIELYQSADLVPVIGNMYAPIGMGGAQARNSQIGDSVSVQLTKQVTETIIVKELVPVTTTKEIDAPGPMDSDGKPTTIKQTISHTSSVEQDVEKQISKTVPDLSALEKATIFEFGYAKLKEKLVGLFGAEHVVDC